MLMLFDWLLYPWIPKSGKSVLIIRPASKTFITGIAYAYRDDQYDASILGKAMSEQEFKNLIKLLNAVMKTFWPCEWTIWFGYLLSPFTLGLSFLLPNLCISEAKHALIGAIER